MGTTSLFSDGAWDCLTRNLEGGRIQILKVLLGAAALAMRCDWYLCIINGTAAVDGQNVDVLCILDFDLIPFPDHFPI